MTADDDKVLVRGGGPILVQRASATMTRAQLIQLYMTLVTAVFVAKRVLEDGGAVRPQAWGELSALKARVVELCKRLNIPAPQETSSIGELLMAGLEALEAEVEWP